MSEADTLPEPNQYQSLPDPTAVFEGSILDGTDETSLENQPENQRLDSHQTPQLARNEQPPEVATDISFDVTDREADLSASATTPFASTDKTAIALAQENNWIASIQKLRQHNRGLLERVNQLEQALGEYQEALQSQKAKSQAQETIIAKAAQEITTFQEQVTRLFRELESSHQVAQRQQILIETLTDQLESSQERVAQMERECTLTQQRYNEQTHLLTQTENTTRELRDRLHRQQRHTLQFKAALEKCLEVSAINYEASLEELQTSVNLLGEEHLNTILAAPGVLPKAQPIQPWSAQPDLLADNSSFAEIPNSQEPTADTPRFRPLRPVGEYSSDEESLVIGLWSGDNDEGEMTTSDFHYGTSLPASEIEEMASYQTYEAGIYDPDSDRAMTVFSSTNQQLQQPQDALPESAWLSQSSVWPVFSETHGQHASIEPEVDLSSEPPTSEVDNDGSEPYLAENSQNVETFNFSSVPIQEEVAQPDGSEPEAVVSFEDWTMRSATETDSTQSPQPILSQPNWPSPVVYPLRPSRGRKSLAAVELPTFPPASGQQSSEPNSQA